MDRWCAFAVDPWTFLPTNGYHAEGLPLEHMPRLIELEHASPDWNQVPTLARSRSGVATLDEATGGNPALSARWREVLEPSGLPHELRAAVRDGRRGGGRTWGALVLLRAADARAFDRDETSTIARLAPAIASGFRRVLVRQQLEHADDVREAGSLVAAGYPPVVRSATGAALAWLDALDDGGGAVPTCVLSALRACRSTAAGPHVVRARARSGRWVTITAERLLGPVNEGGEPEYGVVLQPSRPAEIAAIVGAAHGLTPRESQTVVLVASGRTNGEIARALGVSAHTVGDHLKSIFEKLGASTRGEMTSKLFRDHYLPRESAGQRAGADGWFLPAPEADSPGPP